jgi:hypothetical protein
MRPYRRLIARFLEHYAGHLFNPHWGEQVYLRPENTLEISMVCQGLDATGAKAAWEAFFTWARAATQDFDVSDDLGTYVGPARHWWEVIGNPAMVPDWRPGTPAYHG